MHPATHAIIKRFRKAKKPYLLKMERDMGSTRYKPIKYKHAIIEAFDAGHCVGSVQFRVQTSRGAFVFTGDVNNDPENIAFPPARPIEGNFVAIESTMGDPTMIAKRRSEIYQSIRDFLASSLGNGSSFAVFYGHALGKGQEITKLLNCTSGISLDHVVVGDRTFRNNKIYEKYESPIGRYQQMEKTIPPGKTVLFLDLYQMNKDRTTAARKFKLEHEPPSLIVSAFGDPSFNMPSIVLSSHADFNGLNQYVDSAMAQTKGSGIVIPFHGSHGKLAACLRSRGYAAIDPHEGIVTA